MDHAGLRTEALNMIRRHESFIQFPQTDTEGNVRIGYGTNLTRRGVTRLEAAKLLYADLTELWDFLSSYPFFEGLNDSRKIALLDFCYAIGDAAFGLLHNLQLALLRGDFRAAAGYVQASGLARDENGARRHELARLVAGGGV